MLDQTYANVAYGRPTTCSAQNSTAACAQAVDGVIDFDNPLPNANGVASLDCNGNGWWKVRVAAEWGRLVRSLAVRPRARACEMPANLVHDAHGAGPGCAHALALCLQASARADEVPAKRPRRAPFSPSRILRAMLSVTHP